MTKSKSDAGKEESGNEKRLFEEHQPNRGVMWLLLTSTAILFFGIVTLGVFATISERERTVRSAAAQPQPTKTNPCKQIVFTAKPGEWVRIDGERGCRWNIQRDPAYGEANYLALAWIRPNGIPEEDKMPIGQLDDTYHTADSTSRVDYVLVTADKQPIHFVSFGVPEDT